MQLHPPIARSPLDRTTLMQALQFAAIFALLKLALQVGATIYTTHIGYGYFRDEFYYIICGRFLDWGYVDHVARWSPCRRGSPSCSSANRWSAFACSPRSPARLASSLPDSSPGRSAAAAPHSSSPCSP